MYGGERQTKLYSSHALSHGKALPKVSINLQHPVAAPVGNVKLAKTKKGKLAPTLKPVPVVVAAAEEHDEEPQPTGPRQEQNNYTMRFKSPLGEIAMDVLDIVTSDEENSILVIFKNDEAVTFKPTPGDIFDITYTAKLGRATESLKVFSPNLLYTLPDTGKKVMVLVNAADAEGD